MVWQLILNYILNQVLGGSRDVNPPTTTTPITTTTTTYTNNTAANNTGTVGATNTPVNYPFLNHLSKIASIITNYYKSSKLNGLFAGISELFNILMRADPKYSQSRQYAITGSARLHGKVAVIASGDQDIGTELATQLAQNGWKVIIGIKDDEPTNRIQVSGGESSETKITTPTATTTTTTTATTTGLTDIRALRLDLSSQESVREFAKEVAKLEPRIDLLVNNGHTYESVRRITRDGFERTFAVNYLGHYLLTHMLMKNLKQSENGRVVNVASIGQYVGSIDFNDINMDRVSLGVQLRTYTQSELALILFTRELSKRLIDTNVTVYAVSPEIVRFPGLVAGKNPLIDFLFRFAQPENGVQTLLYVAMDDNLKNESGFYYTNLKKVHPLMPNATDDTAAEKLWALSEIWVKLDDQYRIKSPISPAVLANRVMVFTDDYK